MGDVRLSGTVWAPGQEAATPGVVLVGGSGPADRTNGGYFHALRDRLVAAGVTVLAFDKRGVGGSTGAWASARVDDLAADVAAAGGGPAGRTPGWIEMRSGLFGHSEGGWVALRASAPPRRASLPGPELLLRPCRSSRPRSTRSPPLVSASVWTGRERLFRTSAGRGPEPTCRPRQPRPG